MIFHDIEQNTDEWLDLRTGKLTGSGCSKIMAKGITDDSITRFPRNHTIQKDRSRF